MAGDVSFDVVSDFDEQELRNALDQVRREATQRYDFKGATVDLEQGKDELVLTTDDEFRAGAVKDLIESKAIRRGLSLKIFDWGKVEPAGGNKVRQQIGLRRGPARRPRQEDHQAHPRRVPQGQVADPGRRGPRHGQEQGRPPAGDHQAARARRGRPAPVRELPLARPSRRPGTGRRRSALTECVRPSSRRVEPEPSRPCPRPRPSTSRGRAGRGRTDRRARSRRRTRGRRGRRTRGPEPSRPRPEPVPPTDRSRRRARGPCAPTESRAAGRPARDRAVPVAPRTVGRLIADALARGRGHDRVHRPGRELPRPARRPARAAGIRVVATRHEGGAAFMAEAHGQLTGRPAVVLATRAVGAANLAIGIHTARADSTPDVRDRRWRSSGRTAAGRRSRRPTWSGRSVGSPSGRPSIDTAARARGAHRRGRSGMPSAAGRGRSLIACPRTSSTSSSRARPARRLRSGRSGSSPSRTTSATVLQLLAWARRPVIVAGAGVLRVARHRRSRPPRRAPRGPGDRLLAARRRVPERPPAVPRDDRATAPLRRSADRLEAADAILVLGCRLSEVATFGYAMPRSDVPWAHVDVEPRTAHAGLSAPTHAVPADARTFLRVARRRVSSGVLDAAAYDARRDANEADRAAFEAASVVDGEAWDGPGVHPGRLIGTLNEVLPAAGDRHHRCRQLLRLGRSRLPVPTTGHVRSARRPARWATGCRRRSPRRSSIPAGRWWRSPVTAGSR